MNEVTQGGVPDHVAMIMDGNGRWAKGRGHPRVFGHVRGATRVRPIVQEAKDLGISALTFFAFSTENWSRPQSEIQTLWKLLDKYLKKEVPLLKKENVRLHVYGSLEDVPESLQKTIRESTETLKSNTGLQLGFALSYGGRKDILKGVARCLEDAQKGQFIDLTEEGFSKYLATSGLGNLSEVDLLIRTSGEQRVSNFLLWQLAYAELMFPDILWPDFGRAHFRELIRRYGQRERRFGQIELNESLKNSYSSKLHESRT